MNRRVYLAGPEVFLPVEHRDLVRSGKLAQCAAAGLVGVFPTVPDDQLDGGPEAVAEHWFGKLCEQLRSCDLAVANLTPFRGPSADAGTIWEVGYLVGRGVPVFGYTNSVLAYRDRADTFVEPGHLVEDFDLTDNLMIDRAIPSSNGGVPVERTAVPVGTELTDLTGFVACVRMAAAFVAR